MRYALTDLVDHITGPDLHSLLTPGTLPWACWAPLLTADLPAPVLARAWRAVAPEIAELISAADQERGPERTDRATDLLRLAATIATHPATPNLVRDRALTGAFQICAGTAWTDGHRDALDRVTAACTDPTRVPLAALRRRYTAGFAAVPEAVRNATRRIHDALTPTLHALQGPAGAAAAALLPTFPGTWRDLVATATTIAA